MTLEGGAHAARADSCVLSRTGCRLYEVEWIHDPQEHDATSAADDDGKPTHAWPGRWRSFATGQGAFAANQEFVGILEADPQTDWSRVNIDALRQHLIEMSNVALGAAMKSVPVKDGIHFDATGDGPMGDSIRRMTSAHAATLSGVDGWRFASAEIDGGGSPTVHAPPKDRIRLRGPGFFGALTRRVHHQMHHLMIARGENPH